MVALIDSNLLGAHFSKPVSNIQRAEGAIEVNIDAEHPKFLIELPCVSEEPVKKIA